MRSERAMHARTCFSEMSLALPQKQTVSHFLDNNAPTTAQSHPKRNAKTPIEITRKANVFLLCPGQSHLEYSSAVRNRSCSVDKAKVKKIKKRNQNKQQQQQNGQSGWTQRVTKRTQLGHHHRMSIALVRDYLCRFKQRVCLFPSLYPFEINSNLVDDPPDRFFYTGFFQTQNQSFADGLTNSYKLSWTRAKPCGILFRR